MELFSARLKWVRSNSAMTQGEAAEIIGMSQPGYGKLENGQREPNLETLAKLTNLFKETSDFLIGVTDFSLKAKRNYERFQELNREYIEFQNQLSKEMSMYSIDSDFDSEYRKIRIDYLQKSISNTHYLVQKRHKQTLEALSEVPFVRQETIDTVMIATGEYIR